MRDTWYICRYSSHDFYATLFLINIKAGPHSVIILGTWQFPLYHLFHRRSRDQETISWYIPGQTDNPLISYPRLQDSHIKCCHLGLHSPSRTQQLVHVLNIHSTTPETCVYTCIYGPYIHLVINVFTRIFILWTYLWNCVWCIPHPFFPFLQCIGEVNSWIYIALNI